MYRVVDSGADITIIGGEMFKQVATAAKLRKRDFKPPDQPPHNYDHKPFHLDGRMDLDISFLDKTMKTPVYVKMDAHEPLLLSEGVCRQMGIISYHPEVKPRKAEHTDKPEPKPPATEISETPPHENKCQVPTLRVKLVQSIKLPPNQSVMTEIKLSDTIVGNGPILFEPDLTLCQERGVQVADSVIVSSGEGTAKVMITNFLGISQ